MTGGSVVPTQQVRASLILVKGTVKLSVNLIKCDAMRTTEKRRSISTHS
jgi:hypothetical protein